MSDTNIPNENQYLLNFINYSFKDLMQLYLKERSEKGLGMLQIVGDKKENKVDVMYIPYDKIKEEIQKVVKEREDKCVFLVFDIEKPDDFIITEFKT